MIMDQSTQPKVEQPTQPLREVVAQMIEQYVVTMENDDIKDLHDMVVKEVELGLLKKVLQLCHGNQSLAAKWLGLARGTLRKKLAQYNIE